VLGALELPQAEPVREPQLAAAASAGSRWSFTDWLMENRFLRAVMPATATAAMVLVVFAVTMNMRVSGRVGDLEEENSALKAELNNSNATVTAQLSQAANADTLAVNNIQQLQQTSWAMARTDSQALLLSSPAANSPSQGVLLMSSDGQRGSS
jgi:mannitol-specific phosphotransferase system IIBC component